MYSKVLFVVIFMCVVGVFSEYPSDVKQKLAKLKNKLPKDFEQCSRNAPDRNECIKKSLQILIRTTDKGFPEIGFPPLDPFPVRNTAFNFKRREFTGRVEIKEGNIFGLSKTEIKNVKSSFDNNVVDITIDAFFPRIDIEGTYKGNVLVNKQRHNPKGYCNATMIKADVKWRIVGDIILVNDVEYLNVTQFDLAPNVQDFKFYATGLVPDQVLNDILVNLVNTNWQAQYKKLLKDSKSEWEPLFLNMANKFFLEVPYNVLFPQ